MSTWANTGDKQIRVPFDVPLQPGEQRELSDEVLKLPPIVRAVERGQLVKAS
jgi:hypothetical protein